MICVKLSEDNSAYLHIKGAPDTMYETLCGFCDTDGSKQYVNGLPDCPTCLGVLRYCKGLRLRRTK
ncbi:hypothetical protein LCGC14_0629280 [marine sediment metagenome]|uniref:Uncharacterized protein n=1 Tax=marine sediment metagenome TaxID=412755 RepID=A0A0F9UAT6_9ZZZZ